MSVLAVYRRIKQKRVRQSILRLSVVLIYITTFTAIFLYKPHPASAVQPRSVGTIAQGANTNTVSPGKPAGATPGDVLIALVAVDKKNTTIGVTGGTGGWTPIFHCFDGGPNFSLDFFYRVVDGSEGTTFTASYPVGAGASRIESQVVDYRGVDNASPIDFTPSSCNSGSGTALSTLTGTSATNGALVVAVFAMDNAAGSSFTPSGMTERIDALIDNGAFNNAVSFELADVTQATAGTISSKSSTASATGSWGAGLFALKPVYPGLTQAAYRFLSNLDAQDSTEIQTNPTVGADDTIRGLATDTANGFFYIGGYTNTPTWLLQKRRIDDGSSDPSFAPPSLPSGNVGGLAIDPGNSAIFVVGNNAGNGWRIEKRRMSDGALCTAANCGTQFGVNGVLVNASTASVPSTGSLNSVDIDTTNGYIYVVGYDTTNGNTFRIGKYKTSDGSVDTNFTQSGSSGGGTACTSVTGYVCNNVTNGDDRGRQIAVDPQNGYVYAGGWDSTPGNQEWHMEKRRISDGALCTAANCGTQFATGGIYTFNGAGTAADQILAFQVDTADNAIYVGGIDGNSGDNRWRLEKLSADAGARVTSFGNDATCSTAGVVCYNSATAGGDDQLLDIGLDGSGGFIYTTGQDSSLGATNLQWRIEKRKRSDGTLVSSFGSSGVVNVNPSANNDAPAWISVDLSRNLLYTAGGDRSPGATDQEWRIQKFDLDAGGIWLDTPQDTAALASTNITFRLRLLIAANSQDMLAGDQQFKLQFATKVGTCDTAFTDEVYSDVTTTSSPIKFHDNPSLANATADVNISGDPTDGVRSVGLETIQESNDFTPANDVLNGADGKWDFVMQDNGAFGAYCFRVVHDDGSNTPLDNYTVVPEINFCKNTPTTDALLRGGEYFCSGVKKPFFWAS